MTTTSSARGLSLNVEGGLVPTAGRGNLEKDKLAIVKDWLDEGASFVCLQDLGKMCCGNTPSAELKEAIGDHSIICAGCEDDPAGTVAVLVHESWSVLQQFRLPGTSRCLGVELLRGEDKILVVSVYLWPGMDKSVNMFPNKPTSEATALRRQRRLEAYRICKEVRNWSDRKSVV